MVKVWLLHILEHTVGKGEFLISYIVEHLQGEIGKLFVNLKSSVNLKFPRWRNRILVLERGQLI